MKRECAPPHLFDEVVALGEQKDKRELRRPSRSRAFIASVLGGLALVSPAGSSKQVATLENVGFNTNQVWVEDAAAADQAAEQVADSGANQIRIIVPYTQGGAENKNHLNRTCNAAKAAYNHSLDLMITMEGHFRKDGRLGYLPTGSSEKRQYVTAVSDLMWSLAGDKNPDGSGGCLPEQKNLTIGFFNEANNKKFNVNQHINGKWVAPKDLVELMVYAYPKLKNEAAKDGLDVNLTLIGGDLSTSRSSNAVGFIRQMGRYIKDRGIQEPLWDEFASHYYFQGVDANPEIPAAENIERIKTAVSDNFDNDTPLIYDEVGAWSDTPRSKEKLYGQKLPNTIRPISGTEQGVFYRRFMQEAACQGIEGVLIFHQVDDGAGTHRTGTYYPDGSSKPSAVIVNKGFSESKSGTDCK